MLKTGIRSYILTNDFIFLQRLARLLTTIHRYFPYTCFFRIDLHDYTQILSLHLILPHRLTRLYTDTFLTSDFTASTCTTIHHNPVCVVKCREFRCRIIKQLYSLLRIDWHDYTPLSRICREKSRIPMQNNIATISFACSNLHDYTPLSRMCREKS